MLARARFPLVVLAVALRAADVDVNVHPTKAWVRFRHPRLVYEMLVAALGAALRRPAVVPETPLVGAAARGAEAAAGGGAGQPALFAPAPPGPGRGGRGPLERLGFAFEGFGGAAIVLRAVPAVLKGDEPRRLVEAAVDELAGPRAGEATLDREPAFVARRAAIKEGAPA